MPPAPKRRPKKPGLVGPLRERFAERISQTRIHHFNHRTEQIAAPLQVVKGEGIFCWFMLEPQNWEFDTLGKKVSTWNQQRSRWGQLAEGTERGFRPVIIRRFTLSYPGWEWAQRIDNDAVDPLPMVDGCENWRTTLAHAQNRLASSSLDTRATAVGIWIAETPSKEVLEDLVESVEHPRLEATQTVVSEMMRILRLLEGAGLNGRFATAADMAFLMHRSLSVGLPLPKSVHADSWGPGELGEFYDCRQWQVNPLLGELVNRRREGKKKHRPVEVVGIGPDGGVKKSYVIPLVMGSMPKTTWPESGIDAWGVLMDRTEGPKEMVITGELYPGSAMIKKATLMANTAKAVEDHYVSDHDETPPRATRRAIDEAEETLDQVSEGDNRTAPRFMGNIVIHVYGDTPHEAGDRATKLKTLYQDSAHMTLHETLDPERLMQLMVPGEPRIKGGWERILSMGYLAAAMTNIDAQIGTPHGPYIGFASLSQRPVLFDMHYGPEKLNKSGVFWCFGGPGSGKSSLIWSLAYWATSMGQRSRIFDPSGPLRELVKLPEFRPFSTEFNLSEADEGALSTFAMIPTPLEANYMTETGLDERKFGDALKFARMERGALSVDVLRMQLPYSTQQRDGIDTILNEAVRAVADHELARMVPPTMWNLRWAVEHLASKDGTRREIAQELHDASDSPYGTLIIPTHSRPIEDMSADDKRLVVITMPGINPPEGEPRGWGPTERLSVAPLHLATFLCTNFIYRSDKNEPKNAFMDENRLMNRFASGRQFMDRTGHDSRKYDLFMLISSQHPQDHQTGSAGALVGGMFAGRLPEQSSGDGCRAIGISTEHASVLENLDDGEFVFRDAGTPHNKAGRLAMFQHDIHWHPSIAASSTTPGIVRDEWTGALAPTPAVDPRLVRGAR